MTAPPKHFATSETKVRDYRMLLAQNRMLRSRATGNFRDLLLGIMRDPAMLVYLDNAENVKEDPNENFGRELLELFTMGVGNYTEQDIREASRASLVMPSAVRNTNAQQKRWRRECL